MAVLVEGISVVIKVSSIFEKISNGWEGFKELVPNDTLCSDSELARVGFMTPDDVKPFIRKLEDNGLMFQVKDRAEDITVIDQLTGSTIECDWIEFGHINIDNDPQKKVAACRLVGSNEDQIFMPERWNYETSLSSSYGITPIEHVEKGLKFLRHENGKDVYFNELTGNEVYVGRTGKT